MASGADGIGHMAGGQDAHDVLSSDVLAGWTMQVGFAQAVADLGC